MRNDWELRKKTKDQADFSVPSNFTNSYFFGPVAELGQQDLSKINTGDQIRINNATMEINILNIAIRGPISATLLETKVNIQYREQSVVRWITCFFKIIYVLICIPVCCASWNCITDDEFIKADD